MMKDLKLDLITNDIVIENGDFAWVEGLDLVVQILMIRLKFFYGECAFDTSRGVKYFETIYVKNPNIADHNIRHGF
jgi:hypothetical protein